MSFPMSLRLSTALLLSLFGALPLRADPQDVRHGSVMGVFQELSFEGGMIVTAQHADDRQIKDEFSGSLDLLFNLPLGPGVWTLYIEGSTTPGNWGISSFLPESNADVGTALTRNGKGRLQLSELHYALPLWGGKLFLGLIDPTGFLDTSAIANDETAQFLGVGLVNNPSIEFPDYTLGAAWHLEAGQGIGGSLVLSRSHGLADDGGKYDRLFDLSHSGDGAFIAAEGYGFLGGNTVRLGAWVNTASHERLDGQQGPNSNWGVYGVADGSAGPIRWNLRLGWTNAKVSKAADFQALALEYPCDFATFGLGVARTGASGDLESVEATLQFEAYVRFDPFPKFHISPDIQWIRNSGFDLDGSAWIAGLRMGYNF